METAAFNKAKSLEFVLYVAAKSVNDPYCTRTKLARILNFSDFAAYGELGASISDATYLKYPHGPFPVSLHDAERTLEKEGALRVDRVHSYICSRDRLVALRSPILKQFRPEEIAIIDAAIDELRSCTGQQVTILAHEEPGWKAARYGATIPYRAAFLSPEEPTAADFAWAQGLPDEEGMDRMVHA